MATDGAFGGDPASRLLRRSVLVFLVGGFAVFTVPRTVVTLLSGEPERQVAAVAGLAFWTWLTWRVVIQVRSEHANRDPRFWFTSATGYAVFAVIYVGFAVREITSGTLAGRTIISTVLVVGLAVATAVAGRRVAHMNDANHPGPA